MTPSFTWSKWVQIYVCHMDSEKSNLCCGFWLCQPSCGVATLGPDGCVGTSVWRCRPVCLQFAWAVAFRVLPLSPLWGHLEPSCWMQTSRVRTPDPGQQQCKPAPPTKVEEALELLSTSSALYIFLASQGQAFWCHLLSSPGHQTRLAVITSNVITSLVLRNTFMWEWFCDQFQITRSNVWAKWRRTFEYRREWELCLDGDTELCKVQLCDETKDGNKTENIIFYKRNLGSPSISKVI